MNLPTRAEGGSQPQNRGASALKRVPFNGVGLLPAAVAGTAHACHLIRPRYPLPLTTSSNGLCGYRRASTSTTSDSGA
jgi:hypothetical protein